MKFVTSISIIMFALRVKYDDTSVLIYDIEVNYLEVK